MHLNSFKYHLTDSKPLPAAPKRRIPAAAPRMADPHPLFDDTSAAGSGGAPPGRGFASPPPPPAASPFPPGAAFPVSSLAVAYGSTLATQGLDMVDRNVSETGGLGNRGDPPLPES